MFDNSFVNMNNVEDIERIAYYLGADFSSELIKYQYKKESQAFKDTVGLGMLMIDKIIGNIETEDYRLSILFELDIPRLLLFKEDTAWCERYRIDNFNRFMQFMEYYLKVEKVPFEQLTVVLNALILMYTRKYLNLSSVKRIIGEQNPQVVKLSQANIYQVTTHLMRGISVDRFIQYYPLQKSYDGGKNWKDYFSSIRELQEFKKEHGEIILSPNNASVLLMELLFDSRLLFFISVMVYDVIKYHKPDWNIFDWIYKCKEELEAKEKADKRKNFKIIK